MDKNESACMFLGRLHSFVARAVVVEGNPNYLTMHYVTKLSFVFVACLVSQCAGIIVHFNNGTQFHIYSVYSTVGDAPCTYFVIS